MPGALAPRLGLLTFEPFLTLDGPNLILAVEAKLVASRSSAARFAAKLFGQLARVARLELVPLLLARVQFLPRVGELRSQDFRRARRLLRAAPGVLVHVGGNQGIGHFRDGLRIPPAVADA